MPKATSLGDLLRIRAANAALIDQVNDNLGCALGFKTVKNKRDEEEYERLLADQELRDQFKERLSAYALALSVAEGAITAANINHLQTCNLSGSSRVVANPGAVVNDGALPNTADYLTVFPYLNTPLAGSP